MTIETRDVSGKDDVISMARTMCSPETGYTRTEMEQMAYKPTCTEGCLTRM